jgi:hypothetical protein
MTESEFDAHRIMRNQHHLEYTKGKKSGMTESEKESRRLEMNRKKRIWYANKKSRESDARPSQS